jgi:hypothetical protein
MSSTATRPARIAFVLCAIATAIVFNAPLQAQKAEPVRAPNYDLAAQWTPDKVRKLVFDTSVMPRWLEKSDRFWYAYQTREGRRFMFVDPIKKTRAPLFDHAKLAASLTSITRIPYDAQHLPFSTVRFVRNDGAFEFDVQVPADAAIAAGSAARRGRDRQSRDRPRQHGHERAHAGHCHHVVARLEQALTRPSCTSPG